MRISFRSLRVPASSAVLRTWGVLWCSALLLVCSFAPRLESSYDYEQASPPDSQRQPLLLSHDALRRFWPSPFA